MKLFIVRHGVTDSENQGILQTMETPLGEAGRRQAIACGKKLREEQPDLILASPWQRARETAQIVSRETGVKLEFWEEMHERMLDSRLDGAAVASKINQQFLKDLVTNLDRMDWKFLKGESVAELAIRAGRVREKLLQLYSGKTIVLVTHNIFIRTFIPGCIFGQKFAEVDFMRLFHSLTIENGSISKLEYKPDISRWRLRSLNNTCHLN